MYPIMLNLNQKRIVLIGGGQIAYRKIQKIVHAGGKPIVVAPEILPEIRALPQVTCIHDFYHCNYLKGAQLIFACTDSNRVNQQVAKEADDDQWVNQCGDKEQSDFFNLAEIIEEPFWIGASSKGQSPKELTKYAQGLRKIIENYNQQWQSENEKG